MKNGLLVALPSSAARPSSDRSAGCWVAPRTQEDERACAWQIPTKGCDGAASACRSLRFCTLVQSQEGLLEDTALVHILAAANTAIRTQQGTLLHALTELPLGGAGLNILGVRLLRLVESARLGARKLATPASLGWSGRVLGSVPHMCGAVVPLRAQREVGARTRTQAKRVRTLAAFNNQVAAQPARLPAATDPRPICQPRRRRCAGRGVISAGRAAAQARAGLPCEAVCQPRGRHARPRGPPPGAQVVCSTANTFKCATVVGSPVVVGGPYPARRVYGGPRARRRAAAKEHVARRLSTLHGRRSCRGVPPS